MWWTKSTVIPFATKYQKCWFTNNKIFSHVEVTQKGTCSKSWQGPEAASRRLERWCFQSLRPWQWTRKPSSSMGLRVGVGRGTEIPVRKTSLQRTGGCSDLHIFKSKYPQTEMIAYKTKWLQSGDTPRRRELKTILESYLVTDAKWGRAHMFTCCPTAHTTTLTRDVSHHTSRTRSASAWKRTQGRCFVLNFNHYQQPRWRNRNSETSTRTSTKYTLC